MDTPINPDDKSQCNAHERGKEREKKLSEEEKNNKWVKGFFGKHTFEVEIVKGNEQYIDMLIDRTYTMEKGGMHYY